MMSRAAATTDTLARPAKVIRLMSLLLMAAGAVMPVAGAATWLTVQNQVAAMAMGLGVLVGMMGYALFSVARCLAIPGAATHNPDAAP